jgi:hypothetical protein
VFARTLYVHFFAITFAQLNYIVVRWSTYRHTVERSNEGLGRLAVHVFVEYNNLLIIIHRPLVAVETPTPASIAAHAICTTAARAAARAFEHCTFVPQFLVSDSGAHSEQLNTNCSSQPSANSSAMILLLTLLGAKRMNVRVDKDAVLSDIQRCITALRSAAPMYVHQCRIIGSSRLIFPNCIATKLRSTWREHN